MAKGQKGKRKGGRKARPWWWRYFRPNPRLPKERLERLAGREVVVKFGSPAGSGNFDRFCFVNATEHLEAFDLGGVYYPENPEPWEVPVVHPGPVPPFGVLPILSPPGLEHPTLHVHLNAMLRRPDGTLRPVWFDGQAIPGELMEGEYVKTAIFGVATVVDGEESEDRLFGTLLGSAGTVLALPPDRMGD